MESLLKRQMMANESYAFNTMKDRAQTVGSAAAGLTIFGIGLGMFFHPIVLGIAGTYAAYKMGQGLLLSVPRFRERYINQMIKKGHFEAVAEEAPISRIAREISNRLGRREAPRIYTIDTQTVAGIVMPWGFLWLAKQESIRKLISEEAMPKVFAALPGSNILLTTKEALAKNLSEKKMRFIIAHEMSHLQVDSFSLVSYSKAAVGKMSELLFWGTGIAIGLSLFGIGLPLMATLPALMTLFVANVVSGTAFNFGTRVKERRADRNALYLTRDLEGAKEAMDYVHDDPESKGPSTLLEEAFKTHPGYTSRMRSLSQAFNKVAKYPGLRPASHSLDNGVKQQPLVKPTG